ncbi:hypothetical protein D3C86_2029140 [compost metagenome]
MQAPALHGQAVNAGVAGGHPGEALRQQPRVAGSHHGGGGKHIADLDHRIERPDLGGATDLGVLVTRLAVTVDRQHIE